MADKLNKDAVETNPRKINMKSNIENKTKCYIILFSQIFGRSLIDKNDFEK